MQDCQRSDCPRSPSIITKYGYPVEVHKVTTKDGYILEMHRVPHGRDQNNVFDSRKPVVLVMHGLFADGACWITMGPESSLAYILAEAGYDVWLGNARGTYYSRNHVYLDPDDRRNATYWHFSWEEIGTFDLPAMIDHALATTGKSRLHFIGHSQGTTAFWAMASLRPEYNDRIISMQAYAPVAFMQHNNHPVLQVIVPQKTILEAIASFLGINELLPNSATFSWLGRHVCGDNSLTQVVCSNFLFLMAGPSEADMHNATLFPIKLGHTPAGASIRQLLHYGQQINQNFFRRYDHGRWNNWLIYRSFDPPIYELNKITAPVFLHYSDNDWFADVQDVERLWRELGRPIVMLKVPHPAFGHLDFMWGALAKNFIYDRTINFMRVMGNN